MAALPDTFIVGAYATAPRPNPSTSAVDRADETWYYEGLHSIGSLGGFEVPLLAGGVLHAEDEAWLLGALFPEKARSVPLSIVLTTVPATMVAIGTSPALGLASDDPDGRRAAIALARQACDAVGRLNAAAGRRGAVVAAELVTAPCTLRAPSSIASLTSSLIELGSWDWGGATLVIEHCDAAAPGGAWAPAKGFLRLEEELEAVRQANRELSGSAAPFGIAINWARSVLEARDPTAAVAHIRAAGSLLRGLIFSGCSGAPADAAYGAWEDSHMPHEAAAPGSTLTAELLRAAVVEAAAAAAAGGAPLLFLGAKITLQPREASGEARAAVNAAILSEIGLAVSEAKRSGAPTLAQ